MVTPFQGSDFLLNIFPGRCPGLSYFRPFGAPCSGRYLLKVFGFGGSVLTERYLLKYFAFWGLRAPGVIC